MKSISAATFGLVLVLGGMTTARADYMVFTSRATFEAAITNEQTETFNELGSKLQIFNATGIGPGDGLAQPITVGGSSGFLLAASSNSLAGYYPTNGTFLVGPTTSAVGDGITVNFSGGSSLVGADVANFANNSIVSFVATTSNGEVLSGSVKVDGSTPGSSLGFLGVSTKSPGDYVTSMTFFSPLGANQNVVVDNVSFGTITPLAVPEPTSMALLAIGALGLSGHAVRSQLRKTRA